MRKLWRGILQSRQSAKRKAIPKDTTALCELLQIYLRSLVISPSPLLLPDRFLDDRRIGDCHQNSSVGVGASVGVVNARPFSSKNRCIREKKWSASECMTECEGWVTIWHHCIIRDYCSNTFIGSFRRMTLWLLQRESTINSKVVLAPWDLYLSTIFSEESNRTSILYC